MFSSDITEKTLEESLETSFLNSVPKKGEPGDLLERLNSYHPNIVLTVEEKPRPFPRHCIKFTYKLHLLMTTSSTAESTGNQ